MAQMASVLSDRAQRFPLVAPIQYRSSGLAQWLYGKTVNLSRTGILFEADEKIRKNTILDVRVELASNVMLDCQCTVVRTEKTFVAVHMHRHSLSGR